MKKTLIFSIFWFFILKTLSVSDFSPEKEIKTIQTLPRKPQATLDIEVTKLKTQEILGKIHEKNKTITINVNDFFNIKTNKMSIDKNQYEIYPIENLEVFQFKKTKSLLNNINQNKFQVINTDNNIDIIYENKPEKLYLGIFNKNTSNFDKLYKLNLEKYILPKIDIRTFTFTLSNPVYIKGTQALDNSGSGVYYYYGPTTGDSVTGFANYPLARSATMAYQQGLGTWNGSDSPNAPVPAILKINGNNYFNLYKDYYNPIINSEIAFYSSNSSNSTYINTSFSAGSGFAGISDANNDIRMCVVGVKGTSTYRAGLVIQKWDLSAKNFNFQWVYNYGTVINGNGNQYNIVIPAFDPKSYYDNSATIQSTGSTITKSGTILDFKNGILLGTVKLKDGSLLPNLASDNHGGMRFTGNASASLTNGAKTMNGTIYTTPVGTDPTGVNSNPYFSSTSSRSSLNVYFKLNNTTTLETALPYASSNNRLMKLEVVNSPTFFTELISNLNLTINRIDQAATFTLKNPIPKRNGTTSGYYNLTGATNPSGINTNQNTLSWTGSPISADYGYSLYNFAHKIVVRFTDGANIQKVVFDTDANGKITGTTKYKSIFVGSNTYTIGDFGDGKFSLGMDQWTFASKSGIKIDVLHYDNSYTTPETATDTQAFAKDTFTMNIDALTPETYYKINAGDSDLIVKGGSRTLNIPKVSNPSILIGKVQLTNDDKTITIDTNTTPTNPDGVTFATTGQTLTFSNGTNTVTGTVSIDSSPTNDATGRNLYLNLTSGVIFSGNNYTLNNASLMKLGIKSTANNPVNPTDIYYTLVNNLTLIPGGLTFDKSSSFTFKNPIPKGLANGTGTYILNGATNPTGLLTNQNTLSWGTNNAPITGMTLSPNVHKVGVWITDGGDTQKFSFTTDSNGKLTGTKIGTITVGGNTYIFGDFNSDGNFSFGLQSWNFSNKTGTIIKILHFDNSLDPLTASEAQAFGRDQFTLNIDALTPETYYKVDSNDLELIVKDGIQNLIVPRTGERKLSLGKVKVKNNSQVDKEILTNFSFYQTGETLTFTGSDSTTIEGTVELKQTITEDETGRELVLNILTGTLTPGITYTATPSLVKLGTTDSSGIYYILRNTLNLKLNDAFIANYTINDLDFGAAIANNEVYNEAKTTLNLTIAEDIINPTLSYAIKTSPTTTGNFYTDFKLYPNGVDTSGDFVTTDIWLGNEIKDSNNTQKRTIDINGKVKDISNTNVTTSSILYQNTIELIINLQ